MESVTQPPPPRPELPEGAETPPVWPPWFAAAGFVVALVGTLVLVGTFAAIFGVDADNESPGFVVHRDARTGRRVRGDGRVVRQSSGAPARLAVSACAAPPSGPSLGWAVVGVLAFYLVSAIYAAIVQPDAEQDVVETLGGDEGGFGLVMAGVMVIAVAPVVEEFFFRGFFYRALRTRFAVISAALLDGLLFGIIHFNFEGADGLLILPPLALLGVIFCLVYEKTGSLYPVIGMHAFNNALAFAVQADDGWKVSVIAGPLVLVACAVAPRVLHPGGRRVQFAR